MKHYKGVKRILDIIISVILLVILSLPLLVAMVAISSTSRGGPVFRQKRISMGGREFECYKLRTMYISAPRNLATSEFKDADRYITPVGRFLRRISADELPQLINVIKGDMSLVGPRPLIPREWDMHIARGKEGVYSVRTGITGLAQINGRDSSDDGEKLFWDREYVKKMSLGLDMRIILLTVGCVLTGKGNAVAETKKQMENRG